MADAAPARMSIAGVLLTTILVTAALGGAIGAGYWYVVKPQLDTQSRTLVSLELTGQTLATKVDDLTMRMDTVDGGGAGGAMNASQLASITTRLDAIEAANRASAETLEMVRTQVLERIAADVAEIKGEAHGMAQTAKTTAGAPKAMAAMTPAVRSSPLPNGSKPVATVNFEKIGDTGGAWLAKALEEKLPALRKEIAGQDGCVLFVVGYADRLGPVEVNERIGFQRAESVKATLEILFVGDKDFEGVAFEPTVSLGERVLAVETDDEVGNKANRRVEIHASCTGAMKATMPPEEPKMDEPKAGA